MVASTCVTLNVGSSKVVIKKVCKLMYREASRKVISGNGEDCHHGGSIVKRKAWDMDTEMEDSELAVKHSCAGEGVASTDDDKVAEVGCHQLREHQGKFKLELSRVE